MLEPARENRYKAFLLRLWREGETDTWRAMLEDPHSGERIGFADLGRLFAFLTQETAEDDGDDSASSTQPEDGDILPGS